MVGYVLDKTYKCPVCGAQVQAKYPQNSELVAFDVAQSSVDMSTESGKRKVFLSLAATCPQCSAVTFFNPVYKRNG